MTEHDQQAMRTPLTDVEVEHRLSFADAALAAEETITAGLARIDSINDALPPRSDDPPYRTSAFSR